MQLYFIIWLFCSNRFFLLVRLACIHSLINEFKVKPLHNYNEFVLPFPLDMKLQTKQWWVTHHKSMHFDNIFSNLACGLFEFYVHKLPKVLKEGRREMNPATLWGFASYVTWASEDEALSFLFPFFFPSHPILSKQKDIHGNITSIPKGYLDNHEFPHHPHITTSNEVQFFFPSFMSFLLLSFHKRDLSNPNDP